MRADIAIESMVTILVAVVAAGMLIGLAFGKLPSLSQKISCSAYTIMNAITPVQDGSRPELPSYCTTPRSSTAKISKSRNQTVEEIAAYLLDCWEQGESGGLNESFTCNEFSIASDQNFVLSPPDIIQVLKDNDLCNDGGIMDSAHGCGTAQQILWNRTQINNKDFVRVVYDKGVVVVK